MGFFCAIAKGLNRVSVRACAGPGAVWQAASGVYLRAQSLQSQHVMYKPQT